MLCFKKRKNQVLNATTKFLKKDFFFFFRNDNITRILSTIWSINNARLILLCLYTPNNIIIKGNGCLS